MPSAPVRPASTLLLLRDGPGGLEVFMVVRHRDIDFMGGAMVFPGGRVEPADADPELRKRCAGAEGLDDAALAFRVAAIREAFEECGVLFARPRGTHHLVPATRLAELDARHREALGRDEIGIAEVAAREDLELACDRLVPFAHWITPDLMPRRFDTHFFLAEAPPDQVALHDGSESVDSVWTRPEDALTGARDGRYAIIFPTLANLGKLGRSRSISEALAAARRDSIRTILPYVEQRGDAPYLCIPGDAGYDLTTQRLDRRPG